MTQTAFLFTIEKPGDALDGESIVIAASDEAEADRLAAVRSKLWRAPLRKAGAIRREVELARGVA